MRKLFLAALLFVVATSSAMAETSASVSEVGVGIFLSIRTEKGEIRYLVRFSGSESGEIAPSGDTVAPRSGEGLMCQIVSRDPTPESWDFQYALVASPQEGDWKNFSLDTTYGWWADLGQFQPNRLATPLRFRLVVRDGQHTEFRVAGIKEPVTNFILHMFGWDAKDVTEYMVLYISPLGQMAPASVSAPTTTNVPRPSSQSKYDDAARQAALKWMKGVNTALGANAANTKLVAGRLENAEATLQTQGTALNNNADATASLQTAVGILIPAVKELVVAVGGTNANAKLVAGRLENAEATLQTQGTALNNNADATASLQTAVGELIPIVKGLVTAVEVLKANQGTMAAQLNQNTQAIADNSKRTGKMEDWARSTQPYVVRWVDGSGAEYAGKVMVQLSSGSGVVEKLFPSTLKWTAGPNGQPWPDGTEVTFNWRLSKRELWKPFQSTVQHGMTEKIVVGQ